MGDENWIYSNDPETKQQSLHWKSPQSPRAKRLGRSGFNKELDHFFDVKGIVHCEFVPPNSMVKFDF
jgi:hypothetical protein